VASPFSRSLHVLARSDPAGIALGYPERTALAGAHRIYAVMQIYWNFIHTLNRLRKPPRASLPSPFSRVLAGGPRRGAKMMAHRGYSSGSFPGKKSRFLVNYECHQFLSWSHCGRHGGTLPSSVSCRGEGRYRQTSGGRRKRGRAADTRKGGPPRSGCRFIMTPALPAVSSEPSFLSVSRKNRKSAATPKKYYERVFMAAGCAADLYTVVRMISLKRRLLDVYHRDADTDHRAYARYTRELARPRNAPGCIGS